MLDVVVSQQTGRNERLVFTQSVNAQMPVLSI